MSPDQTVGADADAPIRLFSFGIVLYEVLCGRGPFTGASASRVIASVVNDSPVPPRRLNSSVPDALERMR